jgi:hypothetical protein
MLLGCYAIYNKSRLYPIIYHQQHVLIGGPQSAPEDFRK